MFPVLENLLEIEIPKSTLDKLFDLRNQEIPSIDRKRMPSATKYLKKHIK